MYKWKKPLKYSFSIRQYFWDIKVKKHLYIRFQLGNTFGNICGKKRSFDLGGFEENQGSPGVSNFLPSRFSQENSHSGLR